MSKNTNIGQEDNIKHVDVPIMGRQYECKDVDTRNFINRPISQRIIPSSNMETAYINHPASTRKVLMPVIDCRKESSVEKMNYSTYHPSKTFHPGQTAPYNGYATHIDHESTLFNRFAPLQRGGQHLFVPSSRSELYNEHRYSNGQPIQFKELNKQELFNPFNPNKCNLANNLFQNHTRQQTKDL
jgi:hypothetical protein